MDQKKQTSHIVPFKVNQTADSLATTSKRNLYQQLLLYHPQSHHLVIWIGQLVILQFHVCSFIVY